MQTEPAAALSSCDIGLGSFTVVDVETSGLRATADRVLSVAALTLDRDGRVAHEFHTLVDPGCDPGPVHVHGLTRELLAGAPRFEHISQQLSQLLAGRIMVAHNAGFDYGFLAGEFGRVGGSLPVERRLCTLALARRVEPPTPDYRLSTLATYYGVRQSRAHDALDDARVLAGVVRSLIADAARVGVAPPLLTCSRDNARDVRNKQAWPASPPKVVCEFTYPGRLGDGRRLTQGMKVAFTGATRLERSDLIGRAVAAGLDVTGAVSKRTSLLVTNTPAAGSAKSRSAIAHETPTATESQFLDMLATIQPGTPKGRASVAVRAEASVPPSGPLAGRRVLVLGGPHQDAADARAMIVELGGSAAVNMSATVSDVLALAAAETDPRFEKARQRGLPIHGMELFETASVQISPPEQTPVVPEPCTLSRGQVIDLPIATQGDDWSVRTSWTQDDSYEVDVVAFALGINEKVSTDDDFVFYNQPEAAGIRLISDGPNEQSVEITLDLLAEQCSRIVIAAAIDGTDVTFGTVGAIEIQAAAGNEAGAFARATLDAATAERTLILAEVYRRGDRWRLRAVGQGYPTGLGDLALGYGVDVAGGGQ
ncbi:TerD family protein [Nocardia cyriacigeorgica]|uniref:TerD family protein n=1 Tax=Nocardia cyriacigeorgica TaxID=135487 RepID=UPI00189423E4|nr:TerD family protein [Nocardia cyriacigeorgica]MBF6436800.1 TerD family protein [Nocardia cyriacigeorgica]